MQQFFRIISYCLFFLASHSVFAQTGSWHIVSFKLNLDKRWGLFEESQIRSQLFYKNFSYYEVKGGVLYALRKNISALIGGGRFLTFSDGDNFKTPYVNKEWRIWEQFAVSNYIGRFKLENRIRVEQRWTTSLGYRNRLKYRLNGIVPLNHAKVNPGTFYLTGWDEVYFTNADPHFETNRIYAGTGYQVSKQLTLQSGFLSVTSYRLDDTHSGKNYLQISLLIETNAHKDHHEKTPSSAD